MSLRVQKFVADFSACLLASKIPIASYCGVEPGYKADYGNRFEQESQRHSNYGSERRSLKRSRAQSAE